MHAWSSPGLAPAVLCRYVQYSLIARISFGSHLSDDVNSDRIRAGSFQQQVLYRRMNCGLEPFERMSIRSAGATK